MILKTLPPAGNPIVTQFSSASTQCELHWPGYNMHFVQSGTAALALALLHKKAACKQIAQPEVIVPAYCCPDLIAAARYAGVTPVIVDINPQDPSYNLEALSHALSSNTLAIIAINFMGLKERLTQIKQVAEPFAQVSIIEDNAQWFPASNAEAQFESDYVCFSFGRGKAVSLLGGGLVAVKQNLPKHELTIEGSFINPKKWALKAHLINKLSNPWVYNLLTKFSFLKLGHTQYHPLEAISSFPFSTQQALNVNLLAYKQRESVAEPILDAALASVNGLQPMHSQRRARLLRYPLLCESSEQRNALYQALLPYGASKMYAQTLPHIEGVQNHMWQGTGLYPNAEQFASRFLTLPVHSGVHVKHAQAMAAIINRSA